MQRVMLEQRVADLKSRNEAEAAALFHETRDRSVQPARSADWTPNALKDVIYDHSIEEFFMERGNMSIFLVRHFSRLGVQRMSHPMRCHPALGPAPPCGYTVFSVIIIRFVAATEATLSLFGTAVTGLKEPTSGQLCWMDSPVFMVG